jgi:hypothetical protein
VRRGVDGPNSAGTKASLHLVTAVTHRPAHAIADYLIDMEGVPVREERLIPGAERCIQALQDAGRRFLVLTDTRCTRRGSRGERFARARGRDLGGGARHRAAPGRAAAGRGALYARPFALM